MNTDEELDYLAWRILVLAYFDELLEEDRRSTAAPHVGQSDSSIRDQNSRRQPQQK